MNVRVELTDGPEETIIRCGGVDDRIRNICRYIQEQSGNAPVLTLFKEDREYYLPPEDILFFETEGEHIYAHTADDAFLVKSRLYELESTLPRYFTRVSKSAIVNVRKIFSVTKGLSSSSLIRFEDTHKQIYVSRSYCRELRQKLQERSLL